MNGEAMKLAGDRVSTLNTFYMNVHVFHVYSAAKSRIYTELYATCNSYLIFSTFEYVSRLGICVGDWVFLHLLIRHLA